MAMEPIRSFSWERPKFEKAKRDRWAGWYCSGSITLDPDFFRGISDATQQSEAIQDVLLHELCHHVQRTMYGEVPPHGKEFRKLAYFVNGKLNRDAVQIYHSLAKTPEGKEAERAQKKALALLALTTSSNEHEAAVAAAKYAEFIAQNNIVLDRHSNTLAEALPEIIGEHIWTSKSNFTWLSTIISAVAHVQGCYATVTRKNCSCVAYHFYGRPNKISQSYDLIDYLTEAIERVVSKAKAEANESAPKGKSYWMAFREGVASRVSKSLYDDHNKRMEEGLTSSNGINHIPGLVLRSAFDREYQAVKYYVENLPVKIGKASKYRGSCSKAGRHAGYAAGASISTARQTTGTAQRALNPSH